MHVMGTDVCRENTHKVKQENLINIKLNKMGQCDDSAGEGACRRDWQTVLKLGYTWKSGRDDSHRLLSSDSCTCDVCTHK